MLTYDRAIYTLKYKRGFLLIVCCDISVSYYRPYIVAELVVTEK